MNKLQQKQVQALNRWSTVTIAPSEIHGVGVFAIKDMPSGTRIFADIQPAIFNLPFQIINNNVPENVKDYLLRTFPRIKRNGGFAFPHCRFIAYMNHSDDANYDAKTDTLLKPVKAGEEITEDYRQIEGWEEVYPFLM